LYKACRALRLYLRRKNQRHNSFEAQHHEAATPEAQKRVPGFPQDMWMPMDEAVAKPETYGLAEGWSGAIQGMSTVVRILRPELYRKVRDLVAAGRIPAPERRNPGK
jgi:hypothetical protein